MSDKKIHKSTKFNPGSESIVISQMQYEPITHMDELSRYELEKKQKTYLQKEFGSMLVKVESKMKALTDLAAKLSAIDRCQLLSLSYVPPTIMFNCYYCLTQYIHQLFITFIRKQSADWCAYYFLPNIFAIYQPVLFVLYTKQGEAV